MYTLVSILTIIAALLLIVVVLVQKSKGGGLSSSFGGGNQIMGVRKTTDFIEKPLGLSQVSSAFSQSSRHL